MIVFLGWTADYDTFMIRNLATKMQVKSIVYPEGRYFFFINRITNYKLIGLYLKFWSYIIPRNALLIYKDSDGYGYHKHLDIFQQKKYLLVRNIITEHQAATFKERFKNIYSFDESQCKKYNFRIMPQILPLIEKPTINNDVKKSCYFIGMDKKRIQLLEEIGRQLTSKGIFCEFFVLRDESSVDYSQYYTSQKLTYVQNLKKVHSSEFLLEVNQSGQDGITLRTLESIFHGKKLISNNNEIKKMDFYDVTRIFIFNDIKDFDGDEFEKFINCAYKPVEINIIEKYNCSNFFEALLSNANI